ncbi:MAG: histidine phosphatase family protein [Longimicrobiales bacterium]
MGGAMTRWWTEGGREERVLEAILRVGVAGCFIGHGAFGVIGKEAWLPYFAVAGIPESWAWLLMPLVGSVDILMGLAALVVPVPAVLGYTIVWAAWTALLRPLAGESVFETLERAGNYGVPAAFLVATGFRIGGAGVRDWVRPVSIGTLRPRTRRQVELVLRATVMLLLVGHGGLAVAGKPMLAEHMGLVGMPSDLLAVMGWGEIALGLAVALRPAPALLVGVLAWKLGTEALFPLSGAPFWEFVERAGSYAAPSALLVLSPAGAALRTQAGSRVRSGAVTAGAVLLAAAASGFGGTSTASPGPTDDAVLDRLREGGLVLACRHAITDRSRGDASRVDYDDPATQRVLSDDGRRQARRLGRVLRDLGVPIGEVLASPYARTMDSAELGFGRVEATDALVYGNQPEKQRERRRLLTSPPSAGNRVLMTHQGILYSSLDVERGSIREGDCVVVDPHGADGPRTLGRYGPDEFAALSGARPASPHFSNILPFPGREAPRHLPKGAGVVS